MNTCSIDGCKSDSKVRGWCHMHYSRWQRHGDMHKPLYIRDENKRFQNSYDIDSATGCWLWNAEKRSGYGRFIVKRRRLSAHRYSYEKHVGKIPKISNSYHGMCVCHRCDEPSCVNPDHLFLGTQADNMTDKTLKQRGANKIGGEVVQHIRALYATGTTTHRKLAKKFGITYQNIGAITSGRTWRHIPDDVALLARIEAKIEG